MSNKPHWSVTVSVEGNDVLTIESNCLSGVENVSDYREQIIAAADHLIAFIGREDGPYFDFPPEEEIATEKAHLGKLDIHFQSQFQETPSGVKVSSTLLRKLRGIDISEDHNFDAGEDR